MFDIYAFADYSGSKNKGMQRKHIVLAVVEGEEIHTFRRLTRGTLFEQVKQLLATDKRILFGFDHSYSFPIGFYETITGEPWQRWDQLLRLMEDVPYDARAWAASINEQIQQKVSVPQGPFWGPNFKPQERDPKFPYERTHLKQYRLCEEREARMKPIYKIGGAGAVGLQALCGIPYLAKLRAYCWEQGIPLFCWPFDGWELPERGHVMVEMYPTMFNTGPRTDEEDAMACA